MMTTNKYSIDRRRGMAPLELVMSLPFLLGLFAMLLTIGFVSLEKARVVIESRNEVWKLRPNPQGNPGVVQLLTNDHSHSPFSITGVNDDDAGMLHGKIKGNIKRFSWLGGMVHPEGQSAVLAQSWDHRQVPDFADNPQGPHLSVLDRMIGGDGGIGAIAGGFLGALLGGGLPNQQDIDDADQQAQEAKNRAQEQRNELVRQIEAKKAELRQLQVDRQAKVDERSQKENHRDDKRRQLDDLREQASEQDPVPQSLRNQISRLEDEIEQLNQDIDQINEEINVLDQKIAQKEDGIRQLEDALAQADAEIGRLP